MENLNSIILNDIEYVRKDTIYSLLSQEKNTSLANTMVGKPVIVRSSNEGINIGIVAAADETGVILTSCRRLYYHKPKDKNLSWYEGVAMSGLNEDSIVSGTVDKKVIIEAYSMTECTPKIFKSIMEKTPNAQK